MKIEQKNLMEKLLKENLIISTGCTEPIAVCFASAKAGSYLKEELERIELRISKNIAKNALDAGIPNSKYKGAAFVSALGAMYGNPEDGFQLLENIPLDKHDIAHEFAKKNVKLEIANVNKPFYIEVNLFSKNDKVTVIVQDGHTNITKIVVNDKVVFNKSNIMFKNKKETAKVDFSMKEIFEYVEEIEDFSLIQTAIEKNHNLSLEGLKKDYGLNVGKITPFERQCALTEVLSATTAAIDARMAGAPIPAMICTGSGNQGITTTIPVYEYGKALNSTKEQILKAVAISDLTAIYVKRNLNVISYLCGAVIASCGSTAGITYLLGGSYKDAEYAVKNVLGTLSGMFCDGAKCTCAMKVLSCVTTAIYSANMAVTNNVITEKTGIVEESLIDTIKNLATIEKETSDNMDKSIMKVVIK